MIDEKKWKILLATFVVSVLMSLFLAFYVSVSTNRQVETAEKILSYHINRVITLTPDGKVYEITKAKIKPSMYKKYIRNTIADLLILDKARLTGGFQRIVTSIPVLLTTSREARLLFEYFPSKKENPKAYSRLVAYLKSLLALMSEDNLPEFIYVSDFLSERIIEKEGKFKYEAKMEVVITSYNTITGVRNTRKTVGQITLVGYFNPLEGTENNPYGLKITSFKVTKFKKKD